MLIDTKGDHMQVSCTVHIAHVFAMIMNYVTTDNLRFRIDIQCSLC